MSLSPLDELAVLAAELDEPRRRQLVDFGKFLRQQYGAAVALSLPQPEFESRPEQESVIGAIKRLSRVFYMLDRSKMLHETSALVSEHLLQGREASAVIDDLEQLFRRHYQQQGGELPELPPCA